VCTQTTPYTYDLGTRAGYLLFQGANVTWTPDPSVGLSDPMVAIPGVLTVEFWVCARTADAPAFVTLRQRAPSPGTRYDFLTIGLNGGGRPDFRTATGSASIDVEFPRNEWVHVAVSLDYRNTATAARTLFSVDPPITACWWTNGVYKGAVVLPSAYPLGRCELCVGGEVVNASVRSSYRNNLTI